MKDFVALRQSKYCQPQCTVLTVKVPFGQFRISSRENERNKLALLTVNVGPYTDPALSHPVSAAFQACGSEIQVHIAFQNGRHSQAALAGSHQRRCGGTLFWLYGSCGSSNICM